MRRREFITLLGGVAVWPLAARAQQTARMRRIGWFVGLAEQDQEADNRNLVLVETLQNLGWTVGRNLTIDYRYTTSAETQTFDPLATELVALSPDVLIVNNTPATHALQRATATIPIVFGLLVDPIASGVVGNLARPGGNTTGFTNFEAGMGSKWLEFLKAVSPGIARVALIYNPKTAPYEGIQRSIEVAAPPFGITIGTRGVKDLGELETIIAAAGHAAGTALIVFPDLFTTAHKDRVIALAAQHKVPAIYPYRYQVTNGGLISYGVDSPDIFRRMAGYVDRILKGEKPGDLPVQEPNKFDLVINQTTAKALGLTIPDRLLALADEVIE